MRGIRPVAAGLQLKRGRPENNYIFLGHHNVERTRDKQCGCILYRDQHLCSHSYTNKNLTPVSSSRSLKSLLEALVKSFRLKLTLSADRPSSFIPKTQGIILHTYDFWVTRFWATEPRSSGHYCLHAKRQPNPHRKPHNSCKASRPSTKALQAMAGTLSGTYVL